MNQYIEQARSLMPGGVSSPVRAFGAVGGDPVVIVAGSGSRMTDAEGNEYLDLLSSWGPLILGHAHPHVVAAIAQAAARGTSFGTFTPYEAVLAGIIVSAIPSAEMVRFVSSGTEATMSALRLARAATGRDRVLKFEGCYHGHVDSLLVAAGSGAVTLGLPDSPGVTEGARRDTLICPYNSEQAVREAFARHGDEIGAVIVEPIAANMGVVAPAAGFLETLRSLCDENGSILIFDEVVTGFRVGWRGAQGMLGVLPDITTLGKVIGGGLPIGAYAARSDLMEMVAPSGPVYQAGTLSGNPLSVAAGAATLTVLNSWSGAAGENSYGYLDALGEQLEAGLTEAAKSAGIPARINRVGSMLTLFFTEAEVTDLQSAKTSDTAMFARFFHAMIERGVYLPPSQFEAMFTSLSHTQEEIDLIIEAARDSMEEL